MKKASIDLATKIVQQHGHIQKDETGEFWSSNMDGLIGMSLGYPTSLYDIKKDKTTKVTKAEAEEQIINQLAGEIDSGVLSLSDTWAEDNLK